MKRLGDYIAVCCEALCDCVVDAPGVYVDDGHICAARFAGHCCGEEANSTSANYEGS